jgi:hypothetical protein
MRDLLNIGIVVCINELLPAFDEDVSAAYAVAYLRPKGWESPLSI